MHGRESIGPPDEHLFTCLRERLQRPAVAYLQSPGRIAGGFDTLIYAFQLAHVPPNFAPRLIARIFREASGGQRTPAEGVLQSAIGAGLRERHDPGHRESGKP